MEFALRFRSDLVDLIEQNRRHSSVMLRILRLKIDQRWPEDEMQNRGVIPLRVLSMHAGSFLSMAVIEIVKWTQVRNHGYYLSHRKRKLRLSFALCRYRVQNDGFLEKA